MIGLVGGLKNTSKKNIVGMNNFGSFPPVRLILAGRQGLLVTI
jgi:hypothetical protein